MNNNNVNKNVNVSKLKGMVKSKGFVTAVCSVLVVLVLIVGYNLRIRSATHPVKVPVATRRLTARHLITEEDIKYVDIPSGALSADYYSRPIDVLGQYVNYDTTIQEGSLFYRGSIVQKEELPDEALLNIPEGETLYYLTVNMLTSNKCKYFFLIPAELDIQVINVLLNRKKKGEQEKGRGGGGERREKMRTLTGLLSFLY